MLDQTTLKNLFDYQDGKLLWKERTSKRKNKGKVAGNKMPNPQGYYTLQYQGSRYSIHRMIYRYHHGYVPDLLDHINRDKTDNRIENLRESSKIDNALNSKVYSSNSSGYVGVSYNKRAKKWVSYYYENKVRKHVGTFASAEEAYTARQQEISE